MCNIKLNKRNEEAVCAIRDTNNFQIVPTATEFDFDLFVQRYYNGNRGKTNTIVEGRISAPIEFTVFRTLEKSGTVGIAISCSRMIRFCQAHQPYDAVRSSVECNQSLSVIRLFAHTWISVDRESGQIRLGNQW